MCGIAGYVRRTPHSAPAELAAVFINSLRHRGPDEQTSRITPLHGLINTRLSIVDVAHGHQPFVSDDGKVAVVQNGEIYNFVELKGELEQAGIRFDTHSDTEVILRAYEAWGPDCVKRMNGMFAIAIVDERQQKLLLFRDRLGVKPLFFYNTSSGFYFASEIKSLRRLPDFSPDINPSALYLYLVYNYVPLPETIFKGVFHVEPGTVMSVDLQTVASTVTPYWSIPNEPEDLPANHSTIVDELDEIFRDAVRLRLRSDVPIGVFLSSGLDSSLVAAGLRSVDSASREAFSIRFQSPDFDESQMAADTARSFGWRPHAIDMHLDDLSAWPETLVSADQPHGDISFIALKKLSKEAAKHLKVVYTGDGGDEAFAGYDRYLRLLGRGADDSTLQSFFSTESVFDETSLLPHALTEEFRTSAQPAGTGFELFRRTLSEVSKKDALNQILYMDMRQLLPGTNLVKVDRMTMAHSLEARSPFLDYRFYDYLFRVPGARKLQGGQIRSLERELAERYLPKSTVYRPKRMLAVPIGEWFRGSLKEPLVRFFEHDFDWSRGYFEPTVVKQLVQTHISGAADYRRAIRALIALEIWFRDLEGRAAPEITRHANVG